MKKIKIKICNVGYLPFEFDLESIKNWNSQLFDIKVENDQNNESVFNDLNKANQNKKNQNNKNQNNKNQNKWVIPYDELRSVMQNIKRGNADILIGITYVPLEDEFYALRFEDNKILISFCDVYEILSINNLPLENLILRAFYEYSIVFLSLNTRIPKNSEEIKFTHIETRGCLFDMTGYTNKDIIYSLNEPQICPECINKHLKNKISDYEISQIKKEIKKIKRKKYFRIVQYIQKHPILSIIISSLFAIILNLLASYFYSLF